MNIEIRGRKILLIGNGFDLAHGGFVKKSV